MSKAIYTLSLCGLVLCAASVWAADRDAVAIDTIGVEMKSFDDGDSFKAFVLGEVAVAGGDPTWSILVGGGWGEISPDNLADIKFWEAGLGIKYYLTALTSFSLFGSFGQYYDLADNPEILTGTARFKQRLVPAERAVSPYVLGDFSYRSADRPYTAGSAGDYDEIVLAGFLGCDFMLTDTLSLMLEAGYAVAEKVSGDFETPETVIGRAGFRGYWD